MAFPANASLYAGLASSLQASLQTTPTSAFTSDSSFTSQYGPVTFDAFNSVGVASAETPVDAATAAQVESSLDSPTAAPGLASVGGTLRPAQAASLARIEGYGTFIPVDGYSPPPPPLAPPPPPIPPPPPGATAAPTVATPAPTPTGTSSSVGD